MTRALIVLLVALVGCTKHTPPPLRRASATSPTAAVASDAASSARPGPAPAPLLAADGVIAARSLRLWNGKPPLKMHTFDVVLHNPAPAPRWLVLPTTFPYTNDTKPAPGDSPVAELQIFRLSAHPRVVLAEAIGGTFWAVRLPADGKLTLRQLKIESWWETVPAEVALEVLIAREITVDGEPLAALLGEDPLCETGADVTSARDAGDERALRFWHPEAGHSAPLTLDVESRARVMVPLSRALDN